MVGGPATAAECTASLTRRFVASSPADRWILSRLSAVIAEVDGLLEQFEFGKACEALYHFAWDEFCDWYVELAKVPLAALAARPRRRPPGRCSASCSTRRCGCCTR